MPRGLTGILTVAQPFCLDVHVTLARIERTLVAARQKGARLVVFPECTLGGYLREPGPGESAPTMPRALRRDGPEIARLIELAGDLTVCVGYTEAGSRAAYSSAVCVTGVGMLLCYDKLFAEASRTLVEDGAEIITCMAAWPVDRRRPATRMAGDRQVRHFDVLDQARAIEHQVVWVSSNASGQWGPLEFPGRSKIVDPDGVVLASTSRQGTAFAEVDVTAGLESVRMDI